MGGIPIPDHLIANPQPIPVTATKRHRIEAEAAANHLFAAHWAPQLSALIRLFLSRRGKAATDDLPKLERAADALHARLRKPLDKTAGPLFDQLVHAHRAAEFRRVRDHAAAEANRWRRQASDAFLEHQLMAAGAEGTDDLAFRQALKNGVHEIETFGGQERDASERTAERRARFLSRAVLARLLRLGADDPEQAATLWRRNASLVDPGLRPRVAAGLARALTDARMRAAARTILAAPASGHPDPAVDLATRLELADRTAEEIAPGDADLRHGLREAVTNRVRTARAALARQLRLRRNGLLAAALGDGPSRPATEDDLLARHPRLKLEWLLAPAPLRRRVRAVLRANAAGSHAPTAVARRCQDQALGLLYAWPEAFRRLDLGRPEFHPADPARLKRLLADQFALETGARPAAHRDIRPLLAALGDALPPHALDPQAKD